MFYLIQLKVTHSLPSLSIISYSLFMAMIQVYWEYTKLPVSQQVDMEELRPQSWLLYFAISGLWRNIKWNLKLALDICGCIPSIVTGRVVRNFDFRRKILARPQSVHIKQSLVKDIRKRCTTIKSRDVPTSPFDIMTLRSLQQLLPYRK